MKKEREICALGRRIARLMEASGFTTYKSFEEKAGVRRDCVRKICSGFTKSLRADEVLKVAKMFGMSAEELADIRSETDVVSTAMLVPDAKHPVWFQVKSDEMEPTLTAGTFVLVDADVNSFVSSGIYLTGTRELPVLRRLSMMVNGNIRVVCDNPRYSFVEEIAIQDLHIYGRIIGTFSRI